MAGRRDKTSESRSSESRRRAARVVSASVASVCMLLSILTAYGRDTLLDSDAVANRAAEAAVTPEVRLVVTDAIVDELVVLDPELLQVRPILESIADGLLQTPIYEEILRSGVYDLHQAVFTNEIEQLELELVGVILLMKVSLAKIDPDLAALIPDDLTNSLIDVRLESTVIEGVQISQRVSWLAFIFPVMAFAGLAVFITLSLDRRRALIQSGIAAILIAIAVLLIEWAGRIWVLRLAADPPGRAAGAAVWDVFAWDLIRLALIVAGAGTVLVVIAATGLERVSLGERCQRILSTLERPESIRARWVWTGRISVLGLFLILAPDLAVRLTVTIVGVAFLVEGAAEILHLVAPDRTEALGTTDKPDREGSTGVWRWVAGGMASACLFGFVLVVIGRSDGNGIVGSGGPGCNGSVLLCDRPLDQVAVATSHNSMAAANDGFTGSYQTVGMLEQLADGYRGFLIDTYFGLEDSNGLVLTDRAPVSEAEREKLVADVGEAVVRSAEALREVNELTGGSRDVYLCHSFCELGAVRMADEFSLIRTWLDDHEREILLFVIQDEGPTDQDIAAVLADAGLLDMVHTQKLDEPWPTLGEMIESGRRIWISAENDPGELDWYHDAFVYVQDTPFSQPTTADFTCELNRGRVESPLFLINHWLSPASPTSADEANSRPVIEQRLTDCDEERGLFPNLIAVDYSDRGELLDVVDDINGVPTNRE